MRILILTRNAWDDTNSIGNTVSNFFRDISDAEYANIYFRSAKPNNRLCEKYYRVTEKEVLKNWLSPSKIGRSFEFKADSVDCSAGSSSDFGEKKIISLAHKYNLRFLNTLSDRIWDSKKWINGNLDAFIRSFAPDLVFTFVKALPQYYQTIRLLREKYHIPLLTWIADDEYTGYLNGGKKKQIDRLRYIISESAAVTGCSQEICDYYNSVFGCAATPLYKGCDLSAPVKDKTNDPLSIVYAGNLLFGRLEIIRKISDALENYVDSGGRRVSFEIYSNTPLSDTDISAYFGGNSCTAFKGSESYTVIKKRLSQADIVLHAESFDDAEIIKTRYSFSTKIIDYLQSGSVILAVGPGEISSIKYIRKIPGAFVIDDMDSIKDMLPILLNDSDGFPERAAKTREFALKNHDSKSLAGDLNRLLMKTALYK